MIGAHAYFDGAGSVRIHYRCWTVPSPRAVVLVAHGLGEHSGRYEELARDFARAGLSTYALDHRGHGRSDGKRGHVRSFLRYLQDLERLRRRAVGSAGGTVPVLILGHSLGGLIVIRYLQEFTGVRPLGAVLSAPLLGIAMRASPWKERLARLLLYIAPGLPVSTGLDPKLLSHDPEVVAAYERDPLVHDRITARLFREIQREIEVAESRTSAIHVPLLFLLPQEDRIVRTERAEEFARRLRTHTYAQIRRYPGLYHEVLQEATRSGAIADVLGWVERRITTPVR